MDRSVLKQRAKDVFYGSYWKCVAVTVLTMLGSMLLSGVYSKITTDYTYNDTSFEALFPSASGFPPMFWGIFGVSMLVVYAFTYLVLAPFNCGCIRFFLKLRKNQPAGPQEVFANMGDKTFLNIAKISFIRDICLVLWSMLFFIPGIIKAYEYWAINYILAVRPDIDRKEAFRLSKAIIDGHKWECFVLQLSFLGWILLASLTGSILGIFYVYPYMQATFVEYFSELRLLAIEQYKITPGDVPDYEQYNPPYYPNGFPVMNQYTNGNMYQENGSNQPQPPVDLGFESSAPEATENTLTQNSEPPKTQNDTQDNSEY